MRLTDQISLKYSFLTHSLFYADQTFNIAGPGNEKTQPLRLQVSSQTLEDEKESLASSEIDKTPDYG